MWPPERCNRSSVPWAMPDTQMRIPNAAHWPVTQLGDACALISRGTAPVYVERSDVMAIGQRCVTVAGFDAGKARPHSHRAMRGVVEPACGDVLLNSTGTGTIGRSCVFRHKGQFVLDRHVTVLRPNQARLDGRWLNAILRSVWGQSHLERFCFSGSTNQVELNRVPLATTGLPLPPVHEQRLAAKVLDTLDTTIRQTEAIIEKLKQVKQGLLHDLLTRGIADNGELRPPQSEAPHLYKESALGWIPKAWDAMPMRAACSTITKGTTPAVDQMWQGDEGIRFLRVDNLSFDGRFDFAASNFRISPDTHTHSLGRSRCYPGDVLTNIVGPPLGKLGLITSATGEVNINQAIALFRPSGVLLPAFVLLWLGSALAQTWLRQRAKQTSGQVNLTLALCQELPVLRMGLEEQQRVIDRTQAMQNRLTSEDDKLTKLLALKSGLMDDLLTGRVRVTPLLQRAPA